MIAVAIDVFGPLVNVTSDGWPYSKSLVLHVLHLYMARETRRQL